MTEAASTPLPADDREAREHLQVLQRQLARMPFAYGVFDFVVVWLLVRQDLVLAAALWMAAYYAIQFVRWRYARHALRDPDIDANRALQRLGGVMVGLGLLRVVPVLLLFSRPAPQEQFLLTLVYIAMQAAAVVTAGGRWRTFLAWALLACGSLALAWALQGTAQGAVIAALIVVLTGTLAAYVHDQQRTLATMVRLVQGNEHLAASLRAERDHVEAARLSQTRFFAAASHDLRQPLHALSMNATALELLAREQADPRVRELSHGIQRSLAQSQALLDDLLEISRLDAGAVQPDWQPVALAEMLGAVRDEHVAMAEEQGLWLRIALDPTAAPTVRADPALLRRILHNLVSNAIKYTAQGGVTLFATAAPAGVRVGVVDTGQGIAPADLERVFDEFVQGPQAAHPARDRGLGLGLAIVRRMTRLMDLPLNLSSVPGEGTRAELLLAVDGPAAVT